MMRHGQVRKLLYEYLRGELDAEKQNVITKHLASCKECFGEMEELKAAIDVLEVQRTHPSKELSPEFWKVFAHQVEHRIYQKQYQRKAVPVSAFVERMFVLNRRLIVLSGCGFAAAVVLIAGLFLFRQPLPQQPLQTEHQPVIQQEQHVEQASDRLHQYFRKSKVLLIGIANMNMDDDQAVDLSAEQRVSRDLIEEAHYLQSQPLDRRSEKLIGDLERILIELANMKEHNEMPNVEILRGGIHQENLLFKIRMAESMYDTARILQAINRN